MSISSTPATTTTEVLQVTNKDIAISKSGGTVGFYGATPVAKHSTTGNVTGFSAGVGTASKSDSVWAGSTGSTAYTVGDLVTALKKLGILTA